MYFYATLSNVRLPRTSSAVHRIHRIIYQPQVTSTASSAASTASGSPPVDLETAPEGVRGEDWTHPPQGRRLFPRPGMPNAHASASGRVGSRRHLDSPTRSRNADGVIVRMSPTRLRSSGAGLKRATAFHLSHRTCSTGSYVSPQPPRIYKDSPHTQFPLPRERYGTRTLQPPHCW